MIPFVVYDALDGSIVASGRTDQAGIDALAKHTTLLVGEGAPETHFVDADQTIREKTENPAFLEGTTIRAASLGSSAVIGGQSVTIVGALDLSHLPAGTHRVEIRHAHHLPKIVEVEIKGDYRAERAAAYPPLADFADAIYWCERGDDSKLKAWLEACDAVKAAFPK